ncbi:hypothetical protein PISMIDRAFT_412064 [Pisolithus microcarpus 441]|uniref:Uncharacterized protein n=1 Tax=Pisolithus microcarpus 441 TaxID=765257 RepID=A0A0C9XLJ5_9AGAM|nr:hypothetical protein PISMIDRAFT_412064 [Pisolithus microcarpus 441]
MQCQLRATQWFRLGHSSSAGETRQLICAHSHHITMHSRHGGGSSGRQRPGGGGTGNATTWTTNASTSTTRRRLSTRRIQNKNHPFTMVLAVYRCRRHHVSGSLASVVPSNLSSRPVSNRMLPTLDGMSRKAKTVTQIWVTRK